MTGQPQLFEEIGIMLSERDHAILRGIAVHGGEGRRDYLALLTEKLTGAVIVDAAELATATVRLGSRVRYRIGDSAIMEHTLVIGANKEVLGQTCSLKSIYGLALIGMSSGQSASLLRADGAREVIAVESVDLPEPVPPRHPVACIRRTPARSPLVLDELSIGDDHV